MRIALTGGIGSGKSAVARLLAERGAVVVDADAIARDIVEPGEPALEEIRAEFGDGIIGADGRLDRARLAAIVFEDAEALSRLNAITHPRIAARSAEILAAADPDSVLVYDMPLLVEQGPEALAGWDAIVVVDADDSVRLSRLADRGVDPADARRRMATQASREERASVADYVIDNSGGLDVLAQAVDGLWRDLTAGDA